MKRKSGVKNKISQNKKNLRIKRPATKKITRATKEVAKEAIQVGIHNLKVPAGSHKRKKLLGRGPSCGHGKTCTRGSKGQTSRAGRDFYSGFEGGQTPLIRRIPKRGFVNRAKLEYQIVNLDDLGSIKDTAINPQLLEEKGLIKDKLAPVKILSNGEIKSPITIQAHAFSKKALEKIKNAGGTIEVINA